MQQYDPGIVAVGYVECKGRRAGGVVAEIDRNKHGEFLAGLTVACLYEYFGIFDYAQRQRQIRLADAYSHSR